MKHSTIQKLLCLLFLISPIFALAQERTISGKVTDAETGDNLPGVNIIIKGTSVGTSTDANGSYSLSVSDDNAVLVFSFIGYVTTEAAVGNQTIINQTLTIGRQSIGRSCGSWLRNTTQGRSDRCCRRLARIGCRYCLQACNKSRPIAWQVVLPESRSLIEVVTPARQSMFVSVVSVQPVSTHLCG